MTTKADAHRLRISKTTARVVVRRGDTVLADTTSAVLLLEGSLPPRYYIARDDVTMDLLMPVDTQTHCPFKGDATYWSFDGVDIAWTYLTPIEGAELIAGRVCFFNERTDIEVDGTTLETPQTQWS